MFEVTESGRSNESEGSSVRAPVDVILFDWGGTLADVVRQDELLRHGAMEAARALTGHESHEAADRLIEAILAAESHAAADPEHRESRPLEILAAWAASLGGQAGNRQLQAAGEAFKRAWVGSLEPLPGALDAVRLLRKLGTRMGLVSNVMLPPDACHMELDRQGFGPLLDFHIFSSAVGFRKPSPVFYETALKAAFPQQRPTDLSRVLFVGDSPTLDVMAPAALGMKTALVARAPGAWPEADYARAKPDYRVDRVAELPALLGLA